MALHHSRKRTASQAGFADRYGYIDVDMKSKWSVVYQMPPVPPISGDIHPPTQQSFPSGCLGALPLIVYTEPARKPEDVHSQEQSDTTGRHWSVDGYGSTPRTTTTEDTSSTDTLSTMSSRTNP